ncbi:polyprenol phosphomannose-dependent alpha 1,6 mannosyltransferase MptB [Microtetraspora niveoalba]|uniref:polyprenol phosphomannose-dependent alpha 1,6 mannosyltransferase MptB n=1 Tax=Microtetraspora niveoalba TaxID=46175 RepID=UPI001FDECAAF|nr:polyprenol phosphomannose-dependent alpha 1,6 mannosyltransferase MptB [Microtetraspora niveoalba]
MSRESARWSATLVGPAFVAGSILVTIVVAALGPSAMVPLLRGPGPQPPYSLDLRPDGHLVVALAAVAVVGGAIGLVAGLRGLRRLAAPDPRRTRMMVAAGCLAAGVLAFLPPVGSADHLNYAAYGRIAVLGLDPYVTVPSAVPHDPVAGAVEEWRNTPSVYGPVATGVQALASWIGGDSVRLTVFVLALVNAAAFVATALLLHRITRGDPVRQRRAALLWAVNPLVVYQLAAGMHVDTLAVAFVVAALVVESGVLLGLGIAVKVTVGLVALGPAWRYRRDPRRLLVIAGAATLTVAAAYWLAGPHALDQVLNASKSVSIATPWKLVQKALQGVFGAGAYRSWIQAGSLILMVVLAWLLLRAGARFRAGMAFGAPGSTPGDSDPGWAPGAAPGAARGVVPGSVPDSVRGSVRGSVPGWAPGAAPGAAEAPMVALAVVVAWLFATPYVLPWYDGLALALLAMVPASALDWFVVARLAALSLAYLPARQLDQPPDLGWLVTVVRAQVVPWLLLALTAALVWWAARAGAHARTRRA